MEVNKRIETNPIDETANVEVVEPVTEAPEPVAKKKPVIGIVTDCLKLNVRKKATIGAKVAEVIPAGTKVTIDKEKSENGFYKVKTPSGVSGFCMDKFITIK